MSGNEELEALASKIEREGIAFQRKDGEIKLLSSETKVIQLLADAQAGVQHSDIFVEVGVQRFATMNEGRILTTLFADLPANKSLIDKISGIYGDSKGFEGNLQDTLERLALDGERASAFIKKNGEDAYSDTLQWLAQKGAHPDILTDVAERLPLPLASKAIEALKQAGADVNKKNLAGETYEAILERRRKLETAEYAGQENEPVIVSRFVPTPVPEQMIADKMKTLNEATGMEWHMDEKNEKVWADVPNATTQSAICNSLAFYGVSGVFGKTEDNHSTVAITFRALKDVSDESLNNASGDVKKAMSETATVSAVKVSKLSR